MPSISAQQSKELRWAAAARGESAHWSGRRLAWLWPDGQAPKDPRPLEPELQCRRRGTVGREPSRPSAQIPDEQVGPVNRPRFEVSLSRHSFELLIRVTRASHWMVALSSTRAAHNHSDQTIAEIPSRVSIIEPSSVVVPGLSATREDHYALGPGVADTE